MKRRIGDARIREILERALAVHGGNALTKLQTYKEVSELHGSGPFGMRMSNQSNEISLDRNAACGRWQMSENGKLLVVYQQTPTGVFVWTKKTGTQKLRESDTPFAFVPPMKTGVLGLLALQDSRDTLTLVEKGEIKGKKGSLIVRTQSAPQETLLTAGKGEFSRDPCLTTWAYLFGPDGTLVAERVTQTQPKRLIETQLSYDRFQTFDGVKVPTEIGIKSNQVPSMVSLKQVIKKLTVNASLATTDFQMPCEENKWNLN